MCRAVHIENETCETIGELKAKLGEVVMMDAKRACADFVCCCWVDMEATAKMHGYVLTVEPCDFYFTKGSV